ncbi:MAG: divergent polysaccharide deacetylase family protein [Rhizomicrobium sp.]
MLRIADGAFWIVLVFATSFGASSLATGFPALLGLFVAPGAIAAQASVSESAIRVSLPVPQPPDSPNIRMTIATDDVVERPLHLQGKPFIAIVIDDLGGDVAHTRRAIALPSAVTLSFLPYPEGTPGLVRNAAHAGHEILAHVPMEALGAHNPGPRALMTGLPAEENLRRFEWALARVPGYVGINNHEGSRFTADEEALVPVMQRLGERHVFFFDSKTTADTQVALVASRYGVASAARDIFLDDINDIDAVDAQLHMLEKRAREQGIAIAIGHPREITLDAVAYWTAHQSEFRLVRLSEAIRLKSEARTSLAFLGR